MLKQILLSLLLLSASCNNNNKTNKNSAVVTASKTKNALLFINTYVKNANKMGQAVGVDDYVNVSPLVTQHFKTELKKMEVEAYKKEPVVGLDADPVFDAQYFPDKGFEVYSYDEQTDYLVVKGKNDYDYKLTMKVAEVNGKWLVDGCGMINVPAERRMKR